MNEETRKKLAQDLPANAVKTRDQAGQKLSYIDGHFAVTRANEVFGHDGWSCAVRSIAEVYRGTRPGRDGENVVMVYEAHVAVILHRAGVQHQVQSANVKQRGELRLRIVARDEQVRAALPTRGPG